MSDTHGTLARLGILRRLTNFTTASDPVCMISTHKYPVADNYDSKSPYRRKKSTRFSDLLFNEGNVDQQVRARASDAEQFSIETSSAAQREGYFDAIHVAIGTSLPQTVVFHSCKLSVKSE